jgi:predicted membrane-bound spermidine synthase
LKQAAEEFFVQWYFLFFLVSGFCSILYEIIWLRIAMAQFGVTTAMVSLVIAAFMIGLGIGSWWAGTFSRKYATRLRFTALRLYALMELLIALSAICVPRQLLWGRELLLRTGGLSFSSHLYYVPAGIWLALTLVPWCACMGATFPLAMAAIGEDDDRGLQSVKSFSYLYVANLFGAATGAIIPLFLVELYGFRRTLHISAALNLLLSASALLLSLFRKRAVVANSWCKKDAPPTASEFGSLSNRALLWVLFGTGLTSVGIEVVWVRLYTPSLGTVVYAFAAILALYLIAMDIGSWLYRRFGNSQTNLENGLLWMALGFYVLLSFLSADPRLRLHPIWRVIVGTAPFSCLVGFVTPAIVDRFSRGDPERAGRAYAINIVGCVLGPLISGFILLPLVGERLALCAFAAPWFLAGLKFRPAFRSTSHGLMRSRYLRGASVLLLASALIVFAAEGYDQQYEPREVRRDSTATVVALGSTRHNKRLLVNGVGITNLTPITKMMVHLPAAMLPHPPRRGLVICFGMGTSYLSMLSWGVPSTAVELVPSVPKFVTFFHPDARARLQSPFSHVVIDDGRFYLERSSEQFDVITIDPPPPVEAAGSSLLYSKEFYAIVRQHLTPEGILQQWLPPADPVVAAAVARALKESFPCVRVFHSIEGWGYHFLASATPILSSSAAEMAQKLPSDAARDLMEWGPASNPEEQFAMVLNREISLDGLIAQEPAVSAITDDRPVNEYFALRRLRDSGQFKIALAGNK